MVRLEEEDNSVVHIEIVPAGEADNSTSPEKRFAGADHSAGDDLEVIKVDDDTPGADNWLIKRHNWMLRIGVTSCRVCSIVK